MLVLAGMGFDVTAPANNIVQFADAGGASVAAPALAAGASVLHVRIPATAVAGSINVTHKLTGTASNALTFVPSQVMSPAEVALTITSTAPVGAYQATIIYDPRVVNLIAGNITGGSGAGFTGTPTTVVIDNVLGRVTLNHFQTNSAPAGTFTVANLRFTPAGAGTTSLSLSDVTVTDTSGTELVLTPSLATLSSSSVSVMRVP